MGILYWQHHRAANNDESWKAKMKLAGGDVEAANNVLLLGGIVIGWPTTWLV